MVGFPVEFQDTAEPVSEKILSNKLVKDIALVRLVIYFAVS